MAAFIQEARVMMMNMGGSMSEEDKGYVSKMLLFFHVIKSDGLQVCWFFFFL